MLFRNSIRLLMENFKGVYKILLYKIVVGLIVMALCSALILPEAIELAKSEPVQELLAGVKEFFHAFVSADKAMLENIKDSILSSSKDLTKLVVSKAVELTWTAVGCVFVCLLGRFADTLCYFTVGNILNDKMSTYAETPFTSAYVSGLGKASIYSLAYVPVAFLFDVFAAGLCVLFLMTLNVFVALFLSMTALVAIQALKFTLTGRIMPAMTSDNKRLRDAIKAEDKTERKQWAKLYSNYLVTVYLNIIVNVVAGLFTFGSALLLTIPASFMLLLCVQYVNYYTVSGKKYFITYESIASNPDRGDKERIFNYIEDTTNEEK